MSKRNKKQAMTNSYGKVIGEYKNRMSPYKKNRKEILEAMGNEHWDKGLFPEKFSKKKKKKKKKLGTPKQSKKFLKDTSNEILKEYGISRERLNELRKK